MTTRPRRSALYLPASNAKAIAKARTLPCDIVILDLEDAVAPDMKAAARAQAVEAVRAGGFGDRELVIRINGLDTEWGKDDLTAVSAAGPDALLVPKIDDAAGIGRYAELISENPVPLWAMIETARSLFNLDPIAAMSDSTSLAAFVLGTNDLAKEMGASPGRTRAPFIGALGLTVAAARAYGLTILDGVFNDLEDDEGFLEQAAQAVEFGFDGKTLIHPRQVDLCNAAFMPNEAAVAWSRRILAAFDEPENAAKGAIRVDGRMVERLHLHQARRTLASAGG